VAQKRASPAAVMLTPQHPHSPGSQDPMLGASHSHLKLFRQSSLQEEVGGGTANYLWPRSGSQKVLESDKDVLPPVKGMDWWDLQLSLVTC